MDGLPFDGNGAYARDEIIGTLNGFAVYDSGDTERNYRALYGVSDSGSVRAAIVKSGAYVDFGFGGFVYQRAGGVTLPVTGEASYSGDYAGMRVFETRGGLEFTRADAFLVIDFEDFNETRAVEGFLDDRTIIDPATGDGIGVLPALVFKTGSVSDAGETAGEAVSQQADDAGNLSQFESGNYYAILSGDGAQEIVGVVVVTGAEDGGGNFEETGAFILQKDDG